MTTDKNCAETPTPEPEWEKVQDDDVYAVWVAPDESETETRETEIEPTYYAESGTPMTDDDYEYTYSHTMVRRRAT